MQYSRRSQKGMRWKADVNHSAVYINTFLCEGTGARWTNLKMMDSSELIGGLVQK